MDPLIYLRKNTRGKERIPSLKLTAKAPENLAAWKIRIPSLVGFSAYFSGATSADSFRE